MTDTGLEWRENRGLFGCAIGGVLLATILFSVTAFGLNRAFHAVRFPEAEIIPGQAHITYDRQVGSLVIRNTYRSDQGVSGVFDWYYDEFEIDSYDWLFGHHDVCMVLEQSERQAVTTHTMNILICRPHTSYYTQIFVTRMIFPR